MIEKKSATKQCSFFVADTPGLRVKGYRYKHMKFAEVGRSIPQTTDKELVKFVNLSEITYDCVDNSI